MSNAAERTDAFEKMLDPSLDDALALPEEQSKYPRKKGKELKGGKATKGKKRATRVVEMKEESIAAESSVVGIPAAESSGSKAATSKPAMSKSSASRASSAKKVKSVSPKIFGEKLFVDREFTGGNPKFASLSKYGLWALYKYSGESKSEEGHELEVEMQFRGLSIDRLRDECGNISESVIDTTGEMVDKACKRVARQLKQQQEVAESIKAGMELTGQADSPVLNEAVAALQKTNVKTNMEAESKSEEQIEQAAEQDTVRTIQEAMQEEHRSEGIAAQPDVVHAGAVITEDNKSESAGESIAISDAAATISPTNSATATIAPIETATADKMDNTSSTTNAFDSIVPTTSNIQDVIREEEQMKSLREVVDAIHTLDDYGDFIKYVKGIDNWTAEKGLNLYRFMVPVESRVWKTIGMQPPIINFLEQALKRKDDKSFFAEPFANVTCIYHKLVVDWCTAHGVSTNKVLYEFVIKRHAVYKEYNGFIAKKLGDGE